MKKTLSSLMAALVLCGTVACAQPAQDGPQGDNARRAQRGERGPRGFGFGPMMGRNAEMVPLFGEKLENGDFPEGVWSFNDEGELVATKDAVIWTKEKYSSFVCEFEFNLSEHTNGGFLIQCSDKGNWIPNTIEIQLLDDAGQEPNYHSCGSFYGFKRRAKTLRKSRANGTKCALCASVA